MYFHCFFIYNRVKWQYCQCCHCFNKSHTGFYLDDVWSDEPESVCPLLQLCSCYYCRRSVSCVKYSQGTKGPPVRSVKHGQALCGPQIHMLDLWPLFKCQHDHLNRTESIQGFYQEVKIWRISRKLQVLMTDQTSSLSLNPPSWKMYTYIQVYFK